MNLVVNKNKQYIRFEDETINILKNKINTLYKSNNIIITNSGLHSNSIILEIIKIYTKNEINLFYSNYLYFENIDIIKYFSKNNKINLYEFNLFDNSINDNLIINSDKQNILFIESCSNPYGYIFNFEIINELKIKCPNLIIICDNTWLSNLIFNPFNYNIDIVTISLTKYYTGNIGICGACIIKNNELYNTANEYIKINGIHNSPILIKYINNALNNYYLRMEKLSLLTINIINYLLNKNIEIVHPYLKNHISYNLALKYLNINIYPSTFLIGTDLNKIQLENILNQINLITVSVSFGSNITRIDKNIFNIENKNYLRLSIGYEETSELLIIKINELLKFLNL